MAVSQIDQMAGLRDRGFLVVDEHRRQLGQIHFAADAYDRYACVAQRTSVDHGDPAGQDDDPVDLPRINEIDQAPRLFLYAIEAADDHRVALRREFGVDAVDDPG